MAYNVKLIEYPNGDIQLRYYSSPLSEKEPNDYETESENIETVYETNPFDNNKVVEVNSFDYSLKTQEQNDIRSFNRTKNKIYEYSRCVRWTKFITLTFNEKLVNRYDFDECSRIARKWLHNQRRNAPELQYLLVPELHKDGAIHFHGLLANTGNMKFKESGKLTQNKTAIYNMSSWSYGFTTAVDVYNTSGVAKYIGKYITKDLCDITKGKNRYFVSANMPTPKKSNFLVTDNEDFEKLLEIIANSLGVEVKHISKPRSIGAYVDVDYYELQERKL